LGGKKPDSIVRKMLSVEGEFVEQLENTNNPEEGEEYYQAGENTKICICIVDYTTRFFSFSLEQ